MGPSPLFQNFSVGWRRVRGGGGCPPRQQRALFPGRLTCHQEPLEKGLVPKPLKVEMVQKLLEVGLLKLRVLGSAGPGLQASWLQPQQQNQGPEQGRPGMGAHVHFARQLRVRRLGSHDQRNPSRDGWGGAVSSTSLPTQCQLPGPSVCVTVETVTVGARKWAEGSRVRAGAGVCPPSLPSSMATAGLGAMPRVWVGGDLPVARLLPSHRPTPSWPCRLLSEAGEGLPLRGRKGELGR